MSPLGQISAHLKKSLIRAISAYLRASGDKTSCKTAEEVMIALLYETQPSGNNTMFPEESFKKDP